MITVSSRLVVVIGVVLAAAPARAEDNNVKPSKAESSLDSGVDSFAGEFKTRYAFDLPSFRGLEPNLALRYRSTNGDGMLGVGWDLAGASVIRRIGPRKSAPTYGTSDGYARDGEDLISCTTLGGTHCTKRQTFDRIVFNSTENAWYVWRNDGTELRYGFVSSARYQTSKGTYAWHLDRKRDPHGNIVTYAYFKDTPSNTGIYCGGMYLSQVSYNGVTVTLHRESSAKPASFANGACVMELRQRIKAVDVVVSGTRARIYALGYTSSTSSGRSRLTSVKVYGKDAIVDATGTVTNASTATSLPAATFAYQNNAAPAWASAATGSGISYNNSKTAVTCGAQDVCTYTEYKEFGVLADVNGDARADFIKTRTSQRFYDSEDPKDPPILLGRAVQLAQANGTFGAATGIPLCTTKGGTQLLVGDLNGDGKGDLANMEPDYRDDKWIQYGNGDGTFRACNKATVTEIPGTWRLADVNGDGRQDLFRGTRIYLSNGTFTFNEIATNAEGSLIGDGNGDGIPDTWSRTSKMYLGKGDGTFTATAIPLTGLPPAASDEYWNQELVAEYTDEIFDLNGDGLEDFTRVKRSRNCGFQYKQGEQIIVCGDWIATLTHVALNKGGGAFQQVASATGAVSLHAFTFNDVNGDGVADQLPVSGSATLRLGQGVAADLVSVLENGFGGSTTLTYAGAAEYTNTFLPIWQQVVTSMTNADGRGWSSTTRFEYGGAMWHAGERRLLGFRWAKVTDPTGAYRETYYTQNIADGADTAELDYRRNAAGGVMTYEQFVYARSGNGSTSPYTSLVAESWKYDCSGNSSCKRSLAAASHDAYGNVTTLVEHGDFDLAGDERTTVTTFRPNTTNYVVSLPSLARIYAGAGTTGTLLSRKYLYYDGQTTWDIAPIRGDKTKELVSLLHADGTLNRQITRWQGTYDSWGNLLTETDALGNLTTSTYDTTYRIYRTSLTNALAQKTVVTWDSQCGVQTRATDPNAKATLWSSDALCRVTREDRPDGSFTSYAYVSWGAVSSQRIQTDQSDGPSAGSTAVRRSEEYFDGLARIWRTETEGDANWAGPRRTMDRAYDSRGFVATESAAYLPGIETPRYTTYEYDAIGRKTKTTSADASYQTTSYGDWMQTHTDELGKWKKHWFDGYGRARQTQEHNEGTSFSTHVDHDLLGRRVRITDAAPATIKNETVIAWDSLGRKTSMDDPDMGRWTYAYDDADRLTAQTDAKGQTLTMTYDRVHRLLTRNHGTTMLEILTYDQARTGYANIGRLTTIVDQSGRAMNDHDALGRIATQNKCVDAACYRMSYGYDLNGRLKSLTYPNGEVVTHSYNSAADLVTVGPYLTAATFDGRGRVLTRTLGNGIGERFAYDANRFWLTKKWSERPDATDLDVITYTWDTRGEITSKVSTKSDDDWAYAYDDLRRLTSATNTTSAAASESYTYDAIGRMMSQTRGGAVTSYAYPAAGNARPHAPTTVGTRSFTYDANGNRRSDGIRTLTYDVQNRLVNDGSTTHVYDGNGERVKSGSTVFIGKYYETTGASWTQYYYAGNERIARRSSDGSVHYYHGDFLGSSRLISMPDGSAASAASRKLFSPFGRLLSTAGVLDDPFGLAGARLDPSGLHRMGARYQDADVGQFTQPDPSSDPDPMKPQTLNRYSYVYNNPVRLIDPTGYCAVGAAGTGDPGGGGTGGAEAAAAAPEAPAAAKDQSKLGEDDGGKESSPKGLATGPEIAATTDRLMANEVGVNPANKSDFGVPAATVDVSVRFGLDISTPSINTKGMVSPGTGFKASVTAAFGGFTVAANLEGKKTSGALVGMPTTASLAATVAVGYEGVGTIAVGRTTSRATAATFGVTPDGNLAVGFTARTFTATVTTSPANARAAMAAGMAAVNAVAAGLTDGRGPATMGPHGDPHGMSAP